VALRWALLFSGAARWGFRKKADRYLQQRTLPVAYRTCQKVTTEPGSSSIFIKLAARSLTEDPSKETNSVIKSRKNGHFSNSLDVSCIHFFSQ
jgi:hypothetical protein